MHILCTIFAYFLTAVGVRQLHMWPGLTKPVLSPILKYRETTVLIILCVITRQWLKLRLSNFHTFYTNSLPSRPSTVEESSCQVSHHLDSFLLGVDCIRCVPTWVGGGGRRRERRLFKIFKEKGLGVHQAKLWASRAFGMAKMKGNSQQTCLFNTTQLCSHSQPSQH